MRNLISLVVSTNDGAENEVGKIPRRKIKPCSVGMTALLCFCIDRRMFFIGTCCGAAWCIGVRWDALVLIVIKPVIPNGFL